jgi:predicted secreted Zn-dependent protease
MSLKETANVTVYGGPVVGSSRTVPPGCYDVVYSRRTRSYRGGASGIKAKQVSFTIYYTYTDGTPAISQTITIERIE